MDISTRRGFLNVAALFEGGTLLIGLGLGWAAGVLPGLPLVLRWEDVLWGLAAVVPMLVGFAFAGDIRHQVADLLGRSLTACRWYDLAALALLAGLGEEVLFRGVLQPWVGRWNPWAALVLVNLLFGLAHALTPLYFVFATVVGLYFSWLCTGLPSPGLEFDPPNLLRPIVAHAVYDFIAFLLIIRDYRRDHAGDSPPRIRHNREVMVPPANSPDASPPSPHVAAEEQLNYFAESEQAFQSRFRGARDRWLDPLVRGCLRAGITAEVVSAVAFLMLIPFGALLFVGDGQWPLIAAAACLLTHVALDGLDGPLARRAGTDGRAGAFTDMCLDHAGFMAVSVLLAAAGRLDGVIAAAYVATYTLSVVFTVILNLLHRPLRFVVRTKYFFYALFILHALGAPNWLTPVATAFTLIHAVFGVLGFFAVRSALASLTEE